MAFPPGFCMPMWWFGCPGTVHILHHILVNLHHIWEIQGQNHHVLVSKSTNFEAKTPILVVLSPSLGHLPNSGWVHLPPWRYSHPFGGTATLWPNSQNTVKWPKYGKMATFPDQTRKTGTKSGHMAPILDTNPNGMDKNTFCTLLSDTPCISVRTP